jgi:hypothetical protein
MKQQTGIRFEYTAPGTPQRNGVAERKFATLFSRVRAMKIAAVVDMKTRTKLGQNRPTVNRPFTFPVPCVEWLFLIWWMIIVQTLSASLKTPSN